MTPAATEFVTQLSFAGVTQRKVYLNPWETERKPDHIALAERPDLIIVAPCTANTMAKLANGIADNLLTGALLATKKPVLLAPAMNAGMWTAKATMRNLDVLDGDGYHFVGPDTGNLACGDKGIGRMAEPEAILAAAESLLGAELDKRIC
jgi:phosphopantothenoylcysteine decarboxylase/phosphopantothenate--cysteine ligase